MINFYSRPRKTTLRRTGLSSPELPHFRLLESLTGCTFDSTRLCAIPWILVQRKGFRRLLRPEVDLTGGGASVVHGVGERLPNPAELLPEFLQTCVV